MKKLAIRIASALVLVAFATPALPCGDKPTTAAADAKGSGKKADVKTAAAAQGAKTSSATN
jgi:hypothetical protein